MTGHAGAVQLAQLADRIVAVAEGSLVEELAVVGSFDPGSLDGEQREAVRRLSDEVVDRTGRRWWMLDERTRVAALSRLVERGGPGALAALAARYGPTGPTPLDRVLARALADRSLDAPDRPATAAELVAALDVVRWFDQVEVATGVALARPPEFDRDELAGRLALAETLDPIRRLTAGGCVGRDAELAQLRHFVWEARSEPGTIYQDAPMLVSGIGGVGKSTIVAAFVAELAVSAAERPVAWAYLDLDRPSLRSFRPNVIVDDILRQAASQFPAYRRRIERGRIDYQRLQKGSGIESYYAERWHEAASQIAALVAEHSEGRLVVVVDTYEELARAERASDTLRSDSGSGLTAELVELFAFLSLELPAFRLIVSGRSAATSFQPGGATDERHLEVQAFTGSAAMTLLRHLYNSHRAERGGAGDAVALDDILARQVVDAVGGSPLTLRLAARVLAREGVGAINDAAGRARALSEVRTEFVRGFLYERILAHLEREADPFAALMPQVGRAALVLRVVDPALIEEVVLPALAAIGLWDGAAGTFDQLAWPIFDQLRAETALVLGDEFDSRFQLVLRPDLRGPALLALGYDDAGRRLLAEVHTRAAAYYSARPERPGADEESLYHRCGAGEVLSADELARLAELIANDELPGAGLPAAAFSVLDDAQKGRPPGEAAAQEGRERELTLRARQRLNTGDLDGAEAVLAEIDPAERRPSSPLHAVEAMLREAQGATTEAVRAAERAVEAARFDGAPGALAAAALQLALLQERVGQAQAAVDTLDEIRRSAALIGDPATQLELCLNRTTLAERAGLHLDRWVEELRARDLLRRVTPDELSRYTSLVRLLAATLSHTEPGRLREALSAVGLGVDPPEDLLRTLAGELRGWDPATNFQLSRRLDIAALRGDEQWFQGIVGREAVLAGVIGDVWASVENDPPEPVLEALRAFYVWWGVARPEPPPRSTSQLLEPSDDALDGLDNPDPVSAEPAVPQSAFLTGEVDFGRLEFRQIEELIVGAYPQPEDLAGLGTRIGLQRTAVDWSLPVERNARRFLASAAEGPGLERLVDTVLADTDTTAYGSILRDLVGEDWIERRKP